MELIDYYDKDSGNSISSIKNLCLALDIDESELDEISQLGDDRYVKSEVPKSSGGVRVVYNPHRTLRKVQRRINNRIFNPKSGAIIHWPSFIYGSIPNQHLLHGELEHKDYVACVKNHCLRSSILKVDVQDFFNNIHIDHVVGIFTSFFKYPDDVSNCLAELCCYKGFVVQGALTSSYIASLCLFDVEPDVVRRVKRKGLVYTRLVDDITISSMDRDYDFSYVKSLVIDMLHEKDLPVNVEKTNVFRVSEGPLLVHGLRISFREPRLPADEISRIRASVKNVERLASEPKFRTTHAYRQDYNRCMGRVNKLKRVGHNQHKKLTERLLKVHPKPSKKDLKRIKVMISTLERDYEKKGDNYWFYKRFYRAQERLNLIAKSYPNYVNKLRPRLKKVFPNYDKS
ncbi:reverse transcriptase family protein [Pseudoalteromonas sp. MMG022]|uniref:reverse transcriptase family protein n=1 Tax=Pseudoalteromonas sp. MMG022 TaxID=2909978 RepID=UPI001F268940|nr:reverse transcriptase family protein [Pseudoalteromonas sp. MMG022]MCF6434587.1 reverse transcriptase family protein [Pseudoalteromonas sp. MMG022]